VPQVAVPTWTPTRPLVHRPVFGKAGWVLTEKALR